MFTKTFWKDASERAIATFAQTIIAMVGVLAPMSSFDLLNVHYEQVILVGLVSGILSYLKSIVAARVSDTQSASLLAVKKQGE